MKRIALAVLITLVAFPALAFKTTLRRGDRVAVLHPEGGYGQDIALAVTRNLARELRERGVEASDVRFTYDEVRGDDSVTADYFIEVVRGDADAAPLGGVGIGDLNVGVDISVVVAHVAARLNLYDGRTLELIDSYDFQRRATSVMPTGIGVGRRNLGLWVALPFVQMARYRAAARAVASEAAEAIVE